MPHSIKHYLRPNYVLGATAAIAIVAVVGVFAYTSRKPAGSYVTATEGPIVEEVDTTGTVKAAESLDLAFQAGGRIAYAGPTVGTHVSSGATLATLSAADQQATYEQAQAALKVQEANLASIRSGTRPEDIAVSQAAVSGAQAVLAQSKQALIAAAQDAYIKSDDAVHNKADQFFNNPRTSYATLVITMSDSQAQSTIVNQRIALESLFSSWQQMSNALPQDPNQVDVNALAEATRSNLSQVSAFLDQTAAGLTKAVPTTQYPTATIQAYQSAIAAARANVSANSSALAAALTAEKNAESSLATAQSQLRLKQAGATSDQIAAQEAQVAVAQANVDAAKAQLGKTVISAPISGTITVNNAHAGEIAPTGSPVISMISDSQFQFGAYVSQADLAKLQQGQKATVTLDAYGSPLSAHVVTIDPAATIKDGISTYKVTLQFDGTDAHVQSGLTGSSVITTQSKENVLSIPTSAIITRGTAHFVMRQSGSGDEMVPVTLGISSRDGMTEIVSGLSPTDRIRAFGVQQ